MDRNEDRDTSALDHVIDVTPNCRRPATSTDLRRQRPAWRVTFVERAEGSLGHKKVAGEI